MRDDDGNDQDRMTLRDRFAMAALTGMIAHHRCGNNTLVISNCAYEFADAMLAERAKSTPTRTAEDERADAVAWLREMSGGPATILHDASIGMSNGHHVGAVERAKAGAK